MEETQHGNSLTPFHLRHRLRRALSSLQFKATILQSVLLLSMIAVGTGLFVRLAGGLIYRMQTARCRELGQIMALAAADGMAQRDAEVLDKLAERFVNSTPYLYVAFLDPEGVVVGVAQKGYRLISNEVLRGEQKWPLPPPATPTYLGGKDNEPAYMDMTYPVVSPHRRANMLAKSDELIGYVRLGLDLESVMGSLSTIRDLVSGGAIGLLLLSIPLGFLVVRRIIEPINGLAGIARRYAKGDREARSDISRKDEIGQLARDFNGMAEAVSDTERQLRLLNAELEERVQQRTRQLRELASRDPLTGLYNRRHFGEVLMQRFAEACRYDADLSCIMIDLDDFKAVNDKCGHKVGDELLIMTATTIASQLRAADVAARFGGDEFVMLLPHTNASSAEVLGTRLAEQFRIDLEEQMPDVTTSISVGVASLGDLNPCEAETLVHAADRALYQAKALGKNRVALAQSAR